jgi:hypothetical protein
MMEIDLWPERLLIAGVCCLYTCQDGGSFRRTAVTFASALVVPLR